MSSVARPTLSGPRHQASWDARAAGNFIAGGTGSGLLVVGSLAGLPLWPTVLLGGGLIGLGLACVWFEIGKPWRALNVFFHPRTSWMTREGIVALLVYVLCAGALLFGSTALEGVAALAAAGFVYCQARMLTASRGIPAWREPSVVPLILTTGLAEGGGLALLLSLAVAQAVPVTAAWVVFGLVVIRWLSWHLYAARLTAGTAPAKTLAAAKRLNWPLSLAFHGLPAALILLALALPGVAAIALVAGALLAAAGGWWLKFTLITRMAFTQGFALPVTPARGGGRSGPGTKPGWR